MKIHLIKHDKNGLGYAVQRKITHSAWWQVRFWRNIDREICFPDTCFNKGDLVDLGAIDDTRKNKLFFRKVVE